MKQEHDSSIQLRPWSEGDLPLLQKLLGDPEMMVYLGGAETEEQIVRRHERYLNLNGEETGQMYVILAGDESAGSIGYWEHEMGGQTDYETGWSVLPIFQGQNIATRATVALIDLLRPNAQHRYIHAFPMTTNAASNAICKKAGFTFIEAMNFEYPKGNPIICNDWRLDLLEDDIAPVNS
jgi:RimJ/RimL family protein N-acetyltransferase